MAKAKNRFWSSDKLFGLTAMLISLVTLVIFVKQTNIMEEQSRLSALPYVMIEKSVNTDANTIQFSLVNYGVGPAIIESRKIVYEGKEYDQDLYDFLTKSLPNLQEIAPFNWANVYKGQALPANGKLVMVAVGQNPEEYQIFVDEVEKLQNGKGFYFEIVYRSIYGEHWKISNRNEVPQKLD